MVKHYSLICLLLLTCLMARSANLSEAMASHSYLDLQQTRVAGQVKDENGQGFPGVNVIVKGTSVGTVTDADGRFSLDVPNGTGTIVFSFVGYAQTEVAMDGRTTFDVA